VKSLGSVNEPILRLAGMRGAPLNRWLPISRGSLLEPAFLLHFQPHRCRPRLRESVHVCRLGCTCGCLPVSLAPRVAKEDYRLYQPNAGLILVSYVRLSQPNTS